MTRSPLFTAAIAVLFLPAADLPAQQNRVTAPVNRSRLTAIRGNRRPQAQPQYDQGPVDASMELRYVTLMLKPSAAQQTALETLLAEQQTPGSPNFHNWLTPGQYADRFGLSSSDVAKVSSWLESEGLTVNDVARGRHWITFTGTAERVGGALHTSIHRYRIGGETHYANATEPLVPEALAAVVMGFEGLDNFQDRSYSKAVAADDPAFNSGSSHFMAPDDFAAIYDLKPLYQAGIDGTGQKIAIIGRTDVDLTDIRNFRKRFNLPANDPQVVLFGPDPGSNSGDLGEADLDLEWSGAVAYNATIIYVNSINVRTSAQYAVDNNLAPVMSFSYGGCEQENSTPFRAVAQQAAAQGISWMVSAGDSGAAACDAAFSGQQATKGIAVSFPASIPEITAVGGTMFDEGSGSYWAAANGPNLGSALGYIPEKAWNEDNAGLGGLGSGGGGQSIFFAKPAWQTGPGVPADGARDVPDVSLSAAIHDGYAGTTGGSNVFYTGTSASSPAFAGIVALLNQYLVKNGKLPQAGLGNLNPALYRLAQSAGNAFHDVVNGDNKAPCAQASLGCVNSLLGYSAGPAYDQATGLGSVDGFAFVTQWAAGGSSTTVLTTDVTNVTSTGTVNLTATVTASGGVLDGAVSFTAADAPLGSAALAASGDTGTATLTVPADLLPVGNDTIFAVYSGNASFDASSGTAPVNVSLPSGRAVVVATISPNPVFEGPVDAQGFSWFFTISLKEIAGVAATLTGFTINGQTQSLSNFFGSVVIPAKGTLSSSVRFRGLNPPVTNMYALSGTDARGNTWTQQVPVNFNGTGSVFPAMILTSGPGAVQQNASADSSCQWSQPVFLFEESGFSVQLTRFTAGSTDLSGQIQSIFGTTRLGPYGTLQGTVCLTGIRPPQTLSYGVAGTPDSGGTLTATLAVSLAAAAAAPAGAEVSPGSLSFSAPSSSALSLNFNAGAPQWTASVIPAGRATSWLQVSPASGTGSAQLTVKISNPGLSSGVYNGTILIQSTGALPQFLTVPVAFTAGASPSLSVGGVANAFSGNVAIAPGMLASVYGSNLGPSNQHAGSLPLPLDMLGVSATVNGISARMLDVLPGQLNIQIPYETTAGTAILGINNNGQAASFAINVAPAAPGAWPNFLNAITGAVVTSAKAGDILTTFITGEGDITPELADGATPATGTAVNKLPQPRMPITVMVGGVPATLLFGGIPHGLAGVTQINFTVPSAPPGPQPVTISVGGVPAQPVNLTITQ